MKKTNMKKMPGLNTIDAEVIAVATSAQVRLKAFLDAVGTGGDVSLTGNIKIEAPVEITKGVNIDLAGHTISSEVEGAVLRFKGETSTITGGTVIGASGKDANAVRVDTGATLTIKGGDYFVGSDSTGGANACIYADGGTINIEGGTFVSEGLYKGRYWTLNVKNGTNGKINVTGGRFKHFDPSKPNTDDETTYVSEGYESTPDYYEVTKKASS